MTSAELKAEILDVLKGAAGPMLGTAIQERIGDVVASHEFRRVITQMVVTGDVKAIDNPGERRLYQLGPKKPAPEFAAPPPVAKKRERITGDDVHALLRACGPLTSGEIAEKLHASVKGIGYHLSTIRKKGLVAFNSADLKWSAGNFEAVASAKKTTKKARPASTVSEALTRLESRLGAFDADRHQLHVDVLDRLGRIVDQSISAVLTEIRVRLDAAA